MSLIVNNKVILTPIKDIIEKLISELALRHINLLDKVEYTNTDIRVTCPIHSGGHERTPSCDILLNDKGSIPAGTVKCFGCGYSGSLIKFIAACMGVTYRKAVEWLLDVCDYSYTEEIRDVKFINLSEISTPPKSVVSVEELREYDYIHPYMFERKLTDEIIEKFEVGYDPKTNSLTFPVYVDGECLFVCKRNVKQKFFQMPHNIDKPLYGLDYVVGNTIYVTESIINCLTLWSWGYEAIALFGTGSAHQINQLNNIRQRKIVLCLDGDNAGRIGTTKIKKALTNKIVTYLMMPQGKDVNDLTKEEFEKLVENF